MPQNYIDPIVPFFFFPNREDEMLSQMIELKTRFGLRRFGLIFPHKSIRITRFPEPQVYRDFGVLLLRVKNKLAGYDIQVGWWCHTTLKSGKDSPWQKNIGIDGSTSKIAVTCPLDPGFRETFSNNFATVVQIARPFMVQVEDDFGLRHNPARFGCFCPLHLAEFATRQNHYYSREELLKIFNEETPESKQLRLDWASLSRDSLAGFAALIREKVDQVAPETRILFCQPGTADFDGDVTEAITRAFAGKTRPAVRVYGCDYASDSAISLPMTVFHSLYSCQHLPSDFELYSESDTFPHTRFFMSDAKIKSLMAAAFAYGVNDSVFWPVQSLDNPLEEEGYATMFRAERKRFEALKATVKGCRVDGCEILYDPLVNILPGGTRGNYAWANVTGRLGIPHTSANGKVKLLSGKIIENMSDEEIKKLLRGSVFLDGQTAYALSKKGFSKMIGAEVLPGSDPNFWNEGLRDPSLYPNVNGQLMYNMLFFGRVGTEGGAFYQLTPLDRTEIITDFLGLDEKPVLPGMVRYENEMGGRVAITAFDLGSNNSSSSLLNYRKKEIIRQTIEWLGNEPLPVYVKDTPNVFCVFNRSKSNDYAVVTVINLCSDSFDAITLDIAPEWANSVFMLMDSDGEWHQADVVLHGNTLKINVPLPLLDPVNLKFIKR